jgi:hypothetical protein
LKFCFIHSLQMKLSEIFCEMKRYLVNKFDSNNLQWWKCSIPKEFWSKLRSHRNLITQKDRQQISPRFLSSFWGWSFTWIWLTIEICRGNILYSGHVWIMRSMTHTIPLILRTIGDWIDHICHIANLDSLISWTKFNSSLNQLWIPDWISYRHDQHSINSKSWLDNWEWNCEPLGWVFWGCQKVDVNGSVNQWNFIILVISPNSKYDRFETKFENDHQSSQFWGESLSESPRVNSRMRYPN